MSLNQSAKASTTFVCVPPVINKAPPVRAEPDDRQLTPFEFCILGAVLRLARIDMPKKRLEYAYAAGDKWRKVNEHIGADNQEAFRDKMGEANKKGRVRFNLKGYARVQYNVTIKRTQLLREAGLSTGAINQAKLDGALDRLTRPVGKPETPLLHSWRAHPHRLRLTVNGIWIRPRAFNRVPWPLPNGAVVQSLFLFLFGIDTRNPLEPDSTASRRNSIRRQALYECLGISSNMRPFDQAQALIKSLRLVNEHLGKLRRGLSKLEEPLPHEFRLIESGTDGIHFRPVKPKIRQPRVRLSDMSPDEVYRPITEPERWHLEDIYDRKVSDAEILEWRDMTDRERNKVLAPIKERERAEREAAQYEEDQANALAALKGGDGAYV